MLLSHHRVKRKQEEKKNTVSRLALTLAVFSRNFSDTLVWLNNSEKYKRNFPENPRNNCKSQSPNLSVYQEIIETKKYPKLGGVNDCMRNPTSRKGCVRRKKERKLWEETSISVTLLNFRIFYQADWSYVESGCASDTEDWRKLRAWTDSNGLVRMNPAGLSGPARFPQTLLAVFSRNGWAENFRQPNCVA